ncbi:hypothetical protein NKH28_33140 [Mesorhizobium sp. M1227]|uniref:hypothetical protein n=1 Tax=Mesorhizobium sp. M1227 TaxID=2957071 RepID=UPI00333B5389
MASRLAPQIAGNGYVCDRLHEKIAETQGHHPAEAKPARSNIPSDAHLRKERNIIGRFFNKLKQFRCANTRHDKLPVNDVLM